MGIRIPPVFLVLVLAALVLAALIEIQVWHESRGHSAPPAPSPSSSSGPASQSLPARPATWPPGFTLGVSDSPGGAPALRAVAPFSFRYQYLAGGANTGKGWATWSPNGSFVTQYVDESRQAGMTPVFTYYQLLQSTPGATAGEPGGDFVNLANPATMAAYYDDLKLFFQMANAAGGTVVLHVEPDLWGYLEQHATGGDPRTVPVKVSASGQPDVAGLSDDAAGFAQAIVRLRDRYAPSVLLGYHLSLWATGIDVLTQKPSDVAATSLADKAGQFEQRLGAAFDIAFTDLADRDAAFKEVSDHDGGASWYRPDDFSRVATYLGAFSRTAQLRLVLWQVPFGNTKMQAENNTWDHYQDNKVEWFLDDPGHAHLQAYAQAGVVSILFGRGADGQTCACDASGDGVTNPAPINGNTQPSLSADDDGGFFDQQAQQFLASDDLVVAP